MEPYEELALEVIEFEEDIITTSNGQGIQFPIAP